MQKIPALVSSPQQGCFLETVFQVRGILKSLVSPESEFLMKNTYMYMSINYSKDLHFRKMNLVNTKKLSLPHQKQV